MNRIRISKRKKKISNSNKFDLDITSLLDILVILLVFLIKNYNSSGKVFNIPKKIKLPSSESKIVQSNGVIIQVSPKSIWVDDKLIASSNSNQNLFDPEFYNKDKTVILPLYNELTNIKNTYKQVKNSSQFAKKFSGEANLVLDKSLKYNFIKKNTSYGRSFWI